MSEEILDDEQIYWLSLLRDFGSQEKQNQNNTFLAADGEITSIDKDNNNIQSYLYLDLVQFDNEDNKVYPSIPEPVANPNDVAKKSTWLLGKEIDDTKGTNNEEATSIKQFSIDAIEPTRSGHQTFVGENDANRPQMNSYRTNPSHIINSNNFEDEFSAFHSRFLNQSLRTTNSLYKGLHGNVFPKEESPVETSAATTTGPNNASQSVWHSDYTENIYHMMKNEMVFHQLEQLQDHDNVSAIPNLNPNKEEEKDSSNETFVPMLTEEEYELDRSQRLTKLKSKDTNFAVEIPQEETGSGWYGPILQYLRATKQAWQQQRRETDQQSGKVASSLVQVLQSHGTELCYGVLQQLNERLYLHSLLAVLQEVTNNTLDRTDTLTEQMLSLSTGLSGPQTKYLDTLSGASSGWEQLLVRYSMATLNWKQRQLLKETRDTHLQLATSLSTSSSLSVKDRLMTLMVSSAQKEALLAQMEQGKEPSGTPNTQPMTLISNEEKEEFFPTIHQLLQLELQSAVEGSDGNSEGDTEGAGKVFDATVSDEERVQAMLQTLLVQYFTPPAFQLGTQCAHCSTTFSLTCFRHHCRYCGQSVCHTHSTQKRRLFRFGIIPRVRVCDVCVDKIDARYHYDELLWKDGRVLAYFAHELIPYLPSIISPANHNDTKQCSGWATPVVTSSLALQTTQQALRYATNALSQYSHHLLPVPTTPLLPPATAPVTSILPSAEPGVSQLQSFWQGLEAALLREEAQNSSLYRALALVQHTLQLDTLFPRIGARTLRVALYFFALLTDALHGAHPTLPVVLHQAAIRSSSHSHDQQLNDAIRYASLALRIIYTSSAYEMQRLCKLQGLDLLYTNLETDYRDQQFEPTARMSPDKQAVLAILRHKPVYAMFATTLRPLASSTGSGPRYIFRRPEVVIVIRGEQAAEERLLSGVDLHPLVAGAVLFPPPPDVLMALMTGEHLALDLVLSRLQTTEHVAEDAAEGEHDKCWVSAAVAVQALWVLQQIGPSLTRLLVHAITNNTDCSSSVNNGYEVSVVGHGLGGSIAAVVTVMLHAILPAITSINFSNDNTKTDSNANHKVLVKSVGYGSLACMSAVDKKETSNSTKCKILTVVLRDDMYVQLSCHHSRGSFTKDLRTYLHSLFLPLYLPSTHSTGTVANNAADAIGIGSEESLLWHDSLQRLVSLPHSYYSHYPALLSNNNTTPININAYAANCDVRSNSEEEDDDDLVMVDHHDALPVAALTLSLPGTSILHLLCATGHWHVASHATASNSSNTSDFFSFFHILLSAHALADHAPRALFSALLEARAQLHHTTDHPAVMAPPHWSSLFVSNHCQCCRSPLSWPCSDASLTTASDSSNRSTANSEEAETEGEADGWCGRYHCFHCGQVVCGACSASRAPLPRFGLLFPKRICDTCVLSGDYAHL